MKNAAIAVPAAVLALLLLASACAGGVEAALGVSATQADLSARFQPPSARHLLGTDELGRDLFARLLHGGRVSLSVALAAVCASCAVGTAAGVAAGMAGGWRDALVMRGADFLLALPALPLLIVLSAVDADKAGLGAAFSGPQGSLFRIVALISLFGWTTVARLARARTLTLRSTDFTLAARALGVPRGRIVARHILPGLAGTVLVAGALSAGNVILVESSLSFLGLGIQPPAASWGSMLTHAGEYVWEHPALAFWPGAMIFVTVLVFNALGDGLRRRLDPRARGQRQ